MLKDIKNEIIEMAAKYETVDFINTDTVQFPRRFTEQKDIEIVAFIVSWLTFGSRQNTLEACEKVLADMSSVSSSPYDFIINQKWNKLSCTRPITQNIYRVYTYQNFYDLCLYLRCVYTSFSTMEHMVFRTMPRRGRIDDILVPIVNHFLSVPGIPNDTHSTCKRLCLFLKWMIRKDSPVDIGIWRNFEHNVLPLPMDIRIGNISRELGLITKKSDDMETVRELTAVCRSIFPKDPCKCYYALYGYSKNNFQHEKRN